MKGWWGLEEGVLDPQCTTNLLGTVLEAFGEGGVGRAWLGVGAELVVAVAVGVGVRSAVGELPLEHGGMAVLIASAVVGTVTEKPCEGTSVFTG